MLEELFYDVLQSGLNAYINLDNTSKDKIKNLSGKNVKVQFIGTPIGFYLQFSYEKIYLLSSSQNNVDVELSATPLTFMRYWQAKEKDKVSIRKNIEIKGDMDLADKVNQLFSDLDIPWQEKFSYLFGDIVTQQASNIIDQIKGWMNDNKTSCQQNVTEYLQEEVVLLPTSEEVRDNYIEIEKLRDDVERMEARIRRLIKT